MDYWQKNFWWGAGANFWTINGIFAPSYGNWTGYQLNGQHQDSNNSQYVAVQSGNNINTVPAAAGKQAVWGAFPNGTSHPAAAALSLGASIVYLDDPEDPTINVSHSAPRALRLGPRLHRPHQLQRLRPRPWDQGLQRLLRQQGLDQQPAHHRRRSLRRRQGTPCYTYRDGYFDLNAQALGSGTHAIGVCAYDALGKSGATGCKSTRTVKIDRTPPVVELSGDLYDAQDTGSMVDPFDLKVLATDAHSGVTSEEIRIGGQVQTPVFDSGCSCWSFRYKGGVGPTTVSVVVRDAVGNEWSSSWNVDVLDPKDEGEDEQQFNTDRSAPAPETPSAITESDYCQDTGGVCTEAPPALPEGRSGSGTQGFGWGMSDPSVEFMDRPEFTSLGLKKVRIIVPWDLLALAKPQDLVALGLTRPSLPSRSRSCPKINGNGATRTFNLPFYGQYDGDGEYGKPSYNHSLRGYAAWLNKARAAGYEVMVAFNRTEFRSAYCYLPTTAEYRTAVGAFVDAFPWIKDYAAWNEPDHKFEPTSPFYSKIRGTSSTAGLYRAGQFWRILKSELCTTCRVTAGEFSGKIDTRGGAGSGLQRYIDGTRSSGKLPPLRWSYHAYAQADARPSVANEVGNTRTKIANFIASTTYVKQGSPTIVPELWLTEQGRPCPRLPREAGQLDVRRDRAHGAGGDKSVRPNQHLSVDHAVVLVRPRERPRRCRSLQWRGSDPVPV
ncbi:hypothetical protein GKE82_23205 [Conexibacter sp. W3-3-2]|uniref:hypothetical protein n=1 Tax=Conexibacter sp. W3-3-2 TaxID=2675227 RepID=UPI0012B7A60A|nr:hypothetical protein [Conexibacter sp. W3-3-2]MTD47114.1 hypothetical protein [Conexibacter sp. W3-3-2]